VIRPRNRIAPVEMTVDRPFIYALRDMETGAILFLGRITEPEVRS
jgi:serine protease inhibitor